ncbi:MAG: hypothetical protein IAI48_16450 [Candidatus Eremiobacteraeota bacterium]|nr:hypothetical protein [Candidatus Eremiobacteraeota bacterium]
MPIFFRLSSFALAFVFCAGTATAAIDAFPPPVVVVYPFTVSGNTTVAGAGGNVAVLLAEKLQALGGVEVKPFTPGTERRDYLTAAQKQNADYYVSGFLTPIGSEVSLITQVVSIYGGTVVWSNTSTIRTYADALAEASDLHEAILRHAGRSLSSLGAPPPASTPEAPTKDAAGVNLSKAFGRHRKDQTVAAAPTPAADGSALLSAVGGGADATSRDYAAKSLAASLAKNASLRATAVNVTAADAAAHAGDLCKANATAKTLYASTLDIDAGHGVALDVTAYDCSGKKLRENRATTTIGKRDTVQRAIDRVTAQAIDAIVRAQATAKP